MRIAQRLLITIGVGSAALMAMILTKQNSEIILAGAGLLAMNVGREFLPRPVFKDKPGLKSARFP